MALHAGFLDASAFTIWNRDANGRPNYQYPANPSQNSIINPIVKCINICRGMLTQPKVRQAFMDVAGKYDHQGAWYWRNPSPFRDTDQVTDVFIAKIRARFPLVFLDYTLENPDYLGCHHRRIWDGDFNPLNQSIVVNGQRAGHMYAAQRHATDRYDTDLIPDKQYRTFLFMTANVFLFEIGHVFITFLTRGREITPAHIRPHVIGDLYGIQSEAGLSLQELLLGGTLSFWKDPEAGTERNQCPVPYLVNQIGYYRISPEVIDKTIRCEFEFPYTHDFIPEDRPLNSLGNGMEPSDYSDPLLEEEVAHLRGLSRPLYPEIPFHLLPFDPTLRVQAAGKEE